MYIDSTKSGYITAAGIQAYLEKAQTGSELVEEDLNRLIAYFDLDRDLKLKYHDWLQVVLCCED
jgi:Ca2+-binding EF-hand superfamily protein